MGDRPEQAEAEFLHRDHGSRDEKPDYFPISATISAGFNPVIYHPGRHRSSPQGFHFEGSLI